MIVQTIQG